MRNRRSDNRIANTTNNYFTITPRACYYTEVICDEFSISAENVYRDERLGGARLRSGQFARSVTRQRNKLVVDPLRRTWSARSLIKPPASVNLWHGSGWTNTVGHV